jgi:hypothetical protein
MSGQAPRPISRRTFLRRSAWIVVAGAASVVGAGAASGLLRFGPAPTAGARLAASLMHGEGAARVGRAALASGLVEHDARGLIAGLTSAVPDLDALLRDGTDDDIRAALDVARRRDFASRGAGVIRIGGWVVAATEARACALVALA